VSPLPDEVKNPRELSHLAQVLRQLFIQKLRFASEKPAQDFSLPKELTNPLTLTHFVSFTAALDPYLKQDILETVNANCRMKHLISLLQEEICPPGIQN